MSLQQILSFPVLIIGCSLFVYNIFKINSKDLDWRQFQRNMILSFFTVTAAVMMYFELL